MLVILGLSALNFTNTFAVEGFVAENTDTRCNDGIDNDGDDAIDDSDDECASFTVVEEAPFIPVDENTAERCTDGLDNDGDEMTDDADADCAEFTVIEETPKEEDNSNNGGGSSSGSRPHSSNNSNSNSGSTGEVLGASTDDATCGSMIGSFLRRGMNNNPEEVKKLQSFLNKELSLNIPLTGFFGPITESAVKQFQIKYKDQILAPWVKIGGLVNDTDATGYVFKTTLFVINKIICSTNVMPEPVLQ